MPSPCDLARLYDDHAQALFAFLLDFTGREADARDLLQEVFVRLAREQEPLHGVRNERAFLIRMAHNAAVDLLRRGGTRERNHEAFGLDQPVLAAAGLPDEATFKAELERALAELPSDQRAVVHLKAWSGLTFEEIAEALQISPNTAASRYRYGIDKLRTRLRPLYEEIK
jgi:RNA polymerase sigma-70 factor, ECF subfamily